MSQSNQKSFDYIILGAGIAGLTTARELLKAGYRVALIEKDVVVGGLARTLAFDGFRFDLGGHRFHSNNPAVVQWLRDLLGEELLTVPRRSHINLNQRYVRYPLQFPDALRAFSPQQAVAMVASYALAKLSRKGDEAKSFEEWVVSRFGRKMYTHFFEPYTEKVWGIPCRELSAEWAAQRIGLPSLKEAAKHALFPSKQPPATAITEFYYPRQGFGMISDTLAAQIKQLGGTILTGTTATAVDPSGTITLHNGEQLHGNQIISTIPLPVLVSLLPGGKQIAKQQQLHYRGLITVFLALEQDQVSEDSWTYFPDRELIFGRTHEPKNWSSALVPDNTVTSLCVELFASPHEATWQRTDDDLVQQVVAQLTQLGLVTPGALRKGWVQRLPAAYPIYHLDYRQKLGRLHAFLDQFPSIHLAGRTGSFHYMNSDGVIEDVFRLMASLHEGKRQAMPGLPQKEGRWI